jgi:hypothetical protein
MKAAAFRKRAIPAPSSGRSSRVQRGWLVRWENASGWGIMPKIRPVSLQIPAIASTEPLGFAG